MAITPEQTAAIVGAVGEAFGRVLPPGFELRAHEDALALTSPATLAVYYIGENIGHRLESGRPPVEAVRHAIESLAMDLQDGVTEEVTYPWPKDHRLRKSEFAFPHTRIQDGAVIVWFGREEDALTPPIRIPLPAELAGG